MKNFFSQRGIDCFAPILLSDCRIERPYLLERAGITDGTAILIAIPYYTAACNDPKRNISAYAVSRDYHGFFKELFNELLPALSKAFPQHRFTGFADHSPIAEVEAAAKAGLGIIGKNHLLITRKYSSYIFLGEVVTSAILPCKTQDVLDCENCGACIKACPAEKIGTCLSALTQKKGELTEAEQKIILQYGSAWGCDICQEVCPHTKRAIASGSIFTPIPYFEESTISRLTTKVLDELDEDAFSERAFSWRGRNTIRRNLLLFESEKGEKE
ncbi:MAG: epoxyqueuosine reductase [Clostridia bacterium]|nr:epoxyqueuosine reductase [Clostridia bacterium]